VKEPKQADIFSDLKIKGMAALETIVLPTAMSRLNCNDISIIDRLTAAVAWIYR